MPDHLGWHEQGDGRLYLGIPVASGRIVDGEALRNSAPRCARSSTRFGCDPILMPSQDIILSEIAPQDREAIEAMLRAHGVRLAADMLPARALGAGLPGAADLRPGPDRGRAGAATTSSA